MQAETVACTLLDWMWEPKELASIWTPASLLCAIFPSQTGEVMLFIISFHLRKNVIKVSKALPYYRD